MLVGITGEVAEEEDAAAEEEASADAEVDAEGAEVLGSFLGLLALAAAAAASRVPKSSVKMVSRESLISVGLAHLTSATMSAIPEEMLS